MVTSPVSSSASSFPPFRLLQESLVQQNPSKAIDRVSPNVIPTWQSGPARLCTCDRRPISVCVHLRNAPVCSSNSISIRRHRRFLVVIFVAAVLLIFWILRLSLLCLQSLLRCVLRPIRPCLLLLFLRCAHRADHGWYPRPQPRPPPRPITTLLLLLLPLRISLERHI